MKKLLSFFAIAAALLVVSCNKPQEFLGDEGDLASIHFSVMGDLMTKANSDFATGTKVDKLAVQAFILGSDEAYHLTNANITITPVTGASPLAWDVDMKLAKNRAYKIAFFAYKDGTGIYGVENLSAITVDYSKIAINSDDADAFCAARSLTVAGALSETVELYRPLAQLNIGVSDWEEYKNSTLEEMQDITVAITVNSVPNGLNLIGGETAADGSVAATVSGENIVEFARVDVLDVDDELVTGYDYFSMVYVLASKDKENMTFTADFEFGDETSVDISNIEITNMPYQANYRTNVLGQLLTGNIHYDVEIVPGFMTPDYVKEIAPGFASVAELNAYFAKFETNADNGDIDPEEVILNGVSDGDVISLPKTAENLVIRVNAVCDGTVTIQYAEGAEEATQKPESIYLYFKNLGTLILNTPDSHVELLSGSVLGAATVYTNGDTFVIQQGAKVGSLEVKEGNANIAGKATNVTVNSEEKVEVMVEKTAQVEAINLQTPADVIVEQPKDNIDKDATDNKVCVNVGANAGGSSATAQNGGDIYVTAAAGCAVAALGSSEDDGTNISTVYVATVTGTGTEIDKSTTGAGVVTASEEAAASVETNVAMIGETKYSTLAAAVAAVPANEATTITMIGHENIIGNAGVTIATNQVVTLDLNGKIITNLVNENKASQVIANNGTLTIKDSANGGIITNKAAEGTQPGDWWSTPQYNYATNVIKNSGTLTVQGGTIANTAASSICYAVDNNSTSYDTVLNLEGGTLTGPGTVVRQFCNSTTKKNEVNISGGKVETNGYAAIWTQLPGSSGQEKLATLNITGGVVKAASYAWYDYSYGDSFAAVNYSISGGEIYGWLYSYAVGNGIKPGFITGGSFSKNPSDLLAEGYWYTYENGFYTPFAVDGVLVKYDSSKSAAENGTHLFNTVMAAANGTKFYLTEGVWEVNNNTSRFINKAFTMEGLGNVVILGTSNRYAMVLDDDANNGYVVNLKNLTLKTSNSTTGALHPLYVKNWVTANLYNVTIDTDYFAAVCVDSSNKVIVGGESGFVDGVDTKLNMYGCTIVDGKKVLLNANPTAAYLTTTDCITLAHVTFDAACQGVSAATCEAQFYSTGSNLFVNGEALPQLLPEGYMINDYGRVVPYITGGGESMIEGEDN